jgi:hypothetical protein
MKLRYTGQAFRERHEVGLRALGRSAGIRAARQVDLEKERAVADLAFLAQMITFYRQPDIPCRMDDLVEEIDDAELTPRSTEAPA